MLPGRVSCRQGPRRSGVCGCAPPIPSKGGRSAAMSAYGDESRQHPPPGRMRLAGAHREVLPPLHLGAHSTKKNLHLRGLFLPVKNMQPRVNRVKGEFSTYTSHI